MAKSYSDDLRARVAACVVGGRTCRATAELFGVSVASAVKWSQRLRAIGNAAAKPRLGRPRPAKLAPQREWLLARVRAAPDLTLRGLAAELADRGVVVSHWTVWKLLASEKITFKKKHFAVRTRPPRHSPAA